MAFNVTGPVAADDAYGFLDYAYNHTEDFLALFYLVKPSRTMVANFRDCPNFYSSVSEMAFFSTSYSQLNLRK